MDFDFSLFLDLSPSDPIFHPDKPAHLGNHLLFTREME